MEMLGIGATYIVPAYQRRYSWTREDCRVLLDDIMTAGEQGRTHFMASVLTVEPEAAAPTGRRRLEVIDGQQRLTTASIILAALSERLADEDADWTETLLDMSLPALRRTYLFDTERHGDSRWRLIPTKPDREAFQEMARGGEPPADSQIGVNLRWFRRRLAGLDRGGLETFVAGLMGLRVVGVLIDAADDPQAVFESMNAKGEPLTCMDLTRNHLLMGLPLDAQEDACRVWADIEGILNPSDFDDFLYQWLVYRHLDPRTERDSYRLLLRLEGDRPVLDVLDDMARGAALYNRLFMTGAHDGLPAGLRPLAMYVAERDDANESLALLDNYALRRAVCGLPSASLGGFCRRCLRALDRNPDQTAERLAALMLASADTQARYPTDREFTEALTGTDLYRRHVACRRLLERLEDRAHPNEHVGGLTVEHIMPQRPGREWPVESRRIVKSLGGTLGNLSLTGSNSMLGNRGFAYKRDLVDHGYKASPLWLNRGLKDMDIWDADAIRARGTRLAAEACAMTPYPTAYADMVESYRSDARGEAAPLPEALAEGPCAARFQALSGLVARLHPDWERRPRQDYVGWYARRLRIAVSGRPSGIMRMSVSRTDLNDPLHALSPVGTNAGLPLAMPVDDDLTGVEDILRQL